MTSGRALWSLIVVSALVRLACAASIGPGNDEAYHYLFVVHPDWSYFDHPPMLALVERAGLALGGGSPGVVHLRLGFIALFAGSTWLLARLTARLYGPRAAFFAALALNLTGHPSLAAGTFALPDGPLLFFWLLTLDRLMVALAAPPGKLGPWVQVGLAWGGALLSKYHAVFLPAATVLYLILEPTARHWLRRLGPYLAIALGLAAFAPVVWWNAAHDWASFAFQGGRAVGAARFRPEALAAAVLGQAVYLLPWIWLPMLAILAARCRRRLGPIPPPERFLVCQAVVPLSVFMAVACTRMLLPHWTLVGFLALFPMLGAAWERCWDAEPARFGRRLRWYAALPVGIAAFAVLWTHTGLVPRGGRDGFGLVRVSRDPTVDLYGWDEIGRELRRRGLLDRPGTFLFASSWYYSGHLGFALRGSATPVLCYHAWDARSFAFWSRPGDWVGRDGIFVAINDRETEPQCYRRWFEAIEPLGSFDVTRGGISVRKVRLYRCRRQLEPFPFDGSMAEELKRMIAAREAPGGRR